MLNTKKLLYILPDLAYVVELLPSKKPHEFSVQNFRQINGKFLDDNELIEENVVKLIAKLEKDTYSLILPDYLFTNTIVNVKESSEAKVKAHLKEKLLPDLGLEDSTHEVQSFILTQHKGIYKVQLSALEKSVLNPIRIALAKNNAVEIKTIHPLSWTIKSFISLEPSISLVQMGERVYLALQYIGVDQTNSEPVADVENLIETIKTLKGAEPSIQTIYLSSSELVEEKLKEGLKETLPIQQLASFKDEDKMPSYVKKVVEAGMKSLAIKDYQVPEFALGKMVEAEITDQVAEKTVAEIEDSSVDQDQNQETQSSSDELVVPAVVGSDLPKPMTLADETVSDEEKKESSELVASSLESLDDEVKTTTSEATEPQTTIDSSKIDEIENIVESLVTEDQEKDKTDSTVSPSLASATAASDVTATISSLEDLKTVAIDSTSEIKTEAKVESTAKEVVTPVTAVAKEKVTESSTETIVEKSDTEAKTDDATEVDLSQFVQFNANESSDEVQLANKETAKKEKNMTEEQKSTKQVIKNKSGVGSMLKIVFLFLASVSVTVAIGVGIGLGVLSLTKKGNTDVSSPFVEEGKNNLSPTPAATATPTIAPVAEIDKAKLKLLVVNATPTSGYAGKIKTQLEKAGFKNVTAKNAKGEYDHKSNYLLMAKEDPNVLSVLSKDTDLDWEYLAKKEVEDAAGDYDMVLVLAFTDQTAAEKPTPTASASAKSKTE